MDNEKQKQVRQRFEKILSKKFTTCFIAALDKFESTFGEMWGFNEDNPTQEQIKKSIMWQEVRTFILNNGNTQLRALIKELSLHKIDWIGYKSQFLISERKEGPNKDGQK